MKRSLLIFGASTLARLAHFYATHDRDDITVVGFVVDDQFRTASRFLDLPLLTWSEARATHGPTETWFHAAVGYREMRRRAEVFERVKAAGYRTLNLVSPSSFVAPDVALGENNIVMPGVVLEPGVRLGSNNVVWSNVTICHDVTVGNHNFIAANTTIGGHATIGDQNFLGFSTVVYPWRRIGIETLIGAQSLVRDDTADRSVYFGSPARREAAVDPATGIMVS